MNPTRLSTIIFLCASLAFTGCDDDDYDAGVDAGDGIIAGPVIGSDCTADAECMGGECRTGFQDLASTFVDGGFLYVGLQMPGGYCSSPVDVACDSDDQCGSGVCYQPLAGATDTSVLNSDIETQLADVGVCLEACTADSECREAEGYKCQVPLLADLAGVLPANTATYCVQDQTDPCAAARATVPLAGECVLEFDVDGNFEISGAPVAAANASLGVGPGTLVVRTPSSAPGGTPADGDFEVLCYHMNQRMDVAGVITATEAIATDSSPVATGTLSSTIADMTTNCAYDDTTYGRAGNTWTPADPVDAPTSSCVSNYHSFGDVNCTLMIGCNLGGLNEGHNPQDDTWQQPLSDIEFDGTFDNFTMTDVGAPNLFDRLASCGLVTLPEPDAGNFDPAPPMEEYKCSPTSAWPAAAQVPGSDEAACYAEFCALPTGKTEIPNVTTTRTWLDLVGVRTAMTCN